MHRGSPLGAKKTVRLMIALTILAWATQTLFHQWGYGAEMPAAKFVPSTMGFGCTLELRNEAKISGEEIKFKNLFRWADGDKAVFAPMADLTLARFNKDQPFQTLTLEQIRQTLRGASVNLGMIRFAGAMSCQAFRTDAVFDEGIALNQWIESKEITGQPNKPVATVSQPQPTVTLPLEPKVKAPAADAPAVTLRDEIATDLAERLNVPVDSLQLNFDSKNDRLLSLCGPTFRFRLMAKRARDLGQIIYDVTVSTDSGSQKVTLTFEAQAWQTQYVASRAIAYKQIIRDDDINERRILVGHLTEDPILTKDQIVGQQASRDIKPGVLMTGRMIDAVPLVKAGQLVTVQFNHGTVQLTSVARAMENGAYGQTIKVKNETSRDIFDVVVTGPQAGQMGQSDLASAK